MDAPAERGIGLVMEVLSARHAIRQERGWAMSYVNYFEGSNQAPLRPRKQSPDEPNWLEDVWKVVPRRAVITGLLALALLAFEIFNFDTTRYALTSFLGEIRFLSIGWATILAIAFCAIDFAGLVRVFTPETGKTNRKKCGI